MLIVSPEANKLFIGHSNIVRLGTGMIWAEGPAWSNQGQYVVWSDVTADVQYRYIWETGEITPFRRPSYNSNGNTFDFQGRQISAQHFLRRVVRFEHDGTLTVIADSYNGQPLELAQRYRRAQGRQHLVHRSLLRRPIVGRSSR